MGSSERETGAKPNGKSGRFDRLRRWILLSGSRLHISVIVLVTVLLVLLGVGTTWEIEMETLVNETRAVQTLFNTLLGGLILFVSVVLSINTAVLGQELNPLGSGRGSVEDSIEFQTEIETFSDSGVSPAELGEFFLYILRALQTETEALRTAVQNVDSARRREEMLAFADTIDEEIAVIQGRLEKRRRVSTTLLAGLDYDYAHHIYTARRIQEEQELDDQQTPVEPLANVVEILKFFATGRDYFRSLYFKREIQKLSQNLVILSLPVIVFTSYVILAIDAGLFPRQTAFGIQPRLLYVSVAYAVTLSPYVLLSAYILRIVVVSKHSLHAGSFTIRDDAVDTE